MISTALTFPLRTVRAIQALCTGLPTPHYPRPSLRTILFSLTWLLILLSAAYDTYFAWQYRAVLEAWEMNPFILWLAGVGGLASVFLFKLGTMIFSTILAAVCHHRRHRLEIPFTLIVGGVYFVLSFHYLVSQLQS
jgi:hypothetical protein